MIRVAETGRNPTMRHLHRVHRISVACMHEWLGPNNPFGISLDKEPTDSMAADIYTKAFTDPLKWDHACDLINIFLTPRLAELWAANKAHFLQSLSAEGGLRPSENPDKLDFKDQGGHDFYDVEPCGPCIPACPCVPVTQCITSYNLDDPSDDEPESDYMSDEELILIHCEDRSGDADIVVFEYTSTNSNMFHLTQIMICMCAYISLLKHIFCLHSRLAAISMAVPATAKALQRTPVFCRSTQLLKRFSGKEYQAAMTPLMAYLFCMLCRNLQTLFQTLLVVISSAGPRQLTWVTSTGL